MSVRLGGALKELRIHLCQTGKSSQGIRDWICSNYVSVKKANPNFPILIRECNGVQPRIWARYEKGKEVDESVSDKSSSDINTIIKNFASAGGCKC